MAEPKAIVDYGQKCLLCKNDAAASCTICWKHIDDMRDMLDVENTGRALDDIPPSIPAMFAGLDSMPGATGLGERRAPGFASTPPCSLHVVAMGDARSVPYVMRDDDGEALPDDRDGEVRPVIETLRTIAVLVAADIGDTAPMWRSVGPLCSWLSARLTPLSRLPWADDLYRDLRDLRDQLRHAYGDPPPRPLGHCTNTVVVRGEAPGEHVSAQCGHPLYPPAGAKPTARDEPVKDVPVVECGRCHAVYDGLAQLRLSIAERKGA